MASIVRKEKTKYWHAAFIDASGRARRKSTRETDPRKALKIAETFERLAKKKDPVHKRREEVARQLRELYGSDVPTATVRTFIEQWFRLKKPDITVATFQAYQKSAAKFLAFLKASADLDIAQVYKVTIAQFRNQLQLSHSPGTVNADLKFVKAIFKAADADGYLLENPTKGIKAVPHKAESVRRAFTVPELQSILEVADPEWKSLIKFGFYSGQRLGDLARLTWASVDLQREIITFVTRKTGRTIVCPICEPLMEHIITSCPTKVSSGAPLHPRSYRKPINVLSKQFADLLRATGLRQPLVRTGEHGRGRRNVSELSFHCLRITAVSLLKDAGIPQAVVEELIGHDSAKMSALYTRVGQTALAKATSALPAL